MESTSYNVATKWLLEEPDVDAATVRKRAEALSRISDIFGVCFWTVLKEARMGLADTEPNPSVVIKGAVSGCMRRGIPAIYLAAASLFKCLHQRVAQGTVTASCYDTGI